MEKSLLCIFKDDANTLARWIRTVYKEFTVKPTKPTTVEKRAFCRRLFRAAETAAEAFLRAQNAADWIWENAKRMNVTGSPLDVLQEDAERLDTATLNYKQLRDWCGQECCRSAASADKEWDGK